MARYSAPFAKNIMTRAMRAIIDPPPSASEVDELWSYFQSRCAYCDRSIERTSRTGHLDHVEAAAVGGSNSIFNHVLACAHCNGDIKLDTPWQQFLEKMVTDPALRKERKARIDAWLVRAPRWTLNPAAEAIIQQALIAFDKSVAELRALRTSRA